jgi:hypothetical protein
VIAPLHFWRVMAWIGVWKCGSQVAGGEGSGRWQDKSGASRWGVGAQTYELSRASRLTPRLASFRDNRAFLPRNEPAANHLTLQP